VEKKEVIKKIVKNKKKLITGRRKEAVARVKILPGKGQIKVNNKPLRDYFPIETLRLKILQPLSITGALNKLDVLAKVNGGGIVGQADALRHGIARALVEEDKKLRPILKREGFLRRDPRRKERKKYGQKKARKQFQFSKR
jgi:small subunit ribosomal protein S9